MSALRMREGVRSELSDVSHKLEEFSDFFLTMTMVIMFCESESEHFLSLALPRQNKTRILMFVEIIEK